MIHEPKIVWVGFHEEGRYCLDALYDAGLSVCAILTLSDEQIGKRFGAFDYSLIAKKYNIPLKKISHINDESSIQTLETISPDIVFVVGWSQILGGKALSTAKWVVGAHASKLPANRGSAPINWSLINGEVQTGNTLMELLPGVDTGDILEQKVFDITPFDSCKTLYDKVAETNAEMVVEFCKKIRTGEVIKQPQTTDEDTILLRRRPEDGEIDWNRSSKEVYDFIRALTRPYPGAFFYFGSKKCVIWQCSWDPNENREYESGEVLSCGYSFIPQLCNVVIGCSAGAITIQELEVDGKMLFGEDLINYLVPEDLK